MPPNETKTRRRPAGRAPARWDLVRLLPLAGAVGFVGLLHIPEIEPTALDWVSAVAAALLVLAGGRRPAAVALAQCALLAVAAGAGAMLGAGVAQILACVALGEVALRCAGPRMWWCAGALVAASAVNVFPHYSPAAKALILVLDAGVPLLFGAFLRSQRALAAHAEQRAREAEERRAWEAKAARADERAAVARELHDVVAHHVAAVVLRVGVVRHVVPDVGPQVGEALADVHRIGGQALTDLRRLVTVLRDPETAGEPVLLGAAGLEAELAAVLERTRQAGAHVTAEVDAEAAARLDTACRHTALRVVQEGLTNVLKHTGPGVRVRVTVRWEEPARGPGHEGSRGQGDEGEPGPGPEEDRGQDEDREPDRARARDGGVRVEVTDDGGRGGQGDGPRGAASGAVPGVPPGPGHGLLVMRERLELLGGTLHIGPEGTGWALRARLPAAGSATGPTGSATGTPASTSAEDPAEHPAEDPAEHPTEDRPEVPAQALPGAHTAPGPSPAGTLP